VTTERVFGRLGILLEKKKRQLPVKSPALFTGLQARMMVASVARGISAVTYGAKQIPDQGVDFARLETVAYDWLARVVGRFTEDALPDPHPFKDRSLVLRAIPVLASLAALGQGRYAADEKRAAAADAVIADDRIDWSAGAHWDGLAGKTNPQTGKFSVGGGKEYAYATLRALTDPDSPGYRAIRHLDTPVRTATPDADAAPAN
jgi:DNA sulfur modification protein DndB